MTMLKFSKQSQLHCSDLGERESKLKRKDLDKLLVNWSLEVRRLAGNKCEWCGTTKKLQAHHIVARSLCSHAGQTMLANGMCLCFRCHIHRLKADVDGYIQVRDEVLKRRGVSYQELRIKCGRQFLGKVGVPANDIAKIVHEAREKHINTVFENKLTLALNENAALKRRITELEETVANLERKGK